MAFIYMQSGIAPDATGLGDYAYFGLDSNPEACVRLDRHFQQLANGTHSNPSIQDFYDQNGPSQIYTGVIIECPEFYLNTLEKAYINWGNTNQKRGNPKGWNRSSGGEGAKKHPIPYSFQKEGVIHQGNDLLHFLTLSGQAEPKGFIQLLEREISEYEGYSIYAAP